MLQRESPVADTKIKRPQNDNKPYRFLLLMKCIYITLLRNQTNSNLRLLYVSISGIAVYFQNSVIVSSHGLFISLNLYTLTVLMHKCKPEFLKQEWTWALSVKLVYCCQNGCYGNGAWNSGKCGLSEYCDTANNSDVIQLRDSEDEFKHSSNSCYYIQKKTKMTTYGKHSWGSLLLHRFITAHMG